MSYIDKLRDLLPWKRKGFKMLGKFDVKNPGDGDKKVLAVMSERGTDFSKERHVVHYLYFKTEDKRSLAEEQLRSHGYGTRHGVDCGQDYPKSLIVERHGLVNDGIIAQERELLTGVVDALGGNYDGWEAALD